MAIVYNRGEKVHGYTIDAHLSSGQNALSFAARDAAGERVFLKGYKSPSVRVSWYDGFRHYQKEMKQRLEAPPCREFCYRFLDNFEEDRTYFQVFEFLDDSSSLQKVLKECASRPDTVAWDQRVIMAKVILGGLRALHQARIVHADLKPDNIMLIEDPTIRMRYRLKIIDMDFSVLTDRQAPWHGHEGYPGTPGYASPEHLAGKVPQPASDVFTCGLILYELLANGHPYHFDDQEKYLPAYQAYRVPPPLLRGRMPAPARGNEVQQVLHLCLHPDPAKRPTAQRVHEALNGSAPPTPLGPAERSGAGAKARIPACLVLQSETTGKECRLHVSTRFGRALLSRRFEDQGAVYASD
jgi:serine/threonine protein kinase